MAAGDDAALSSPLMSAVLSPELLEKIRRAVGAQTAHPGALVQSLWSGYGEIRRVHLSGASMPCVIVKIIDIPESPKHVRGWNTNTSHQRKIRSYDVEKNFYQHFSKHCCDVARVAKCYARIGHLGHVCLVLEDLDHAGFCLRKSQLSATELTPFLRWLAWFHARFMHQPAEGLWPVGCYWHLQTRQDELHNMADGPLKQSAGALDRALTQCRHQTLVHGDAKLANFCIDKSGLQVAAVDFQYIGCGPGIRDVAYFLGSSLHAQDCQDYETKILDEYFSHLTIALQTLQPRLDARALVDEWRALYCIAWADFNRFLLGWMPEHPKLNKYSESMTERALQAL